MRSRPNILLLLMDDMGVDDLGLHGNRYAQTPHLDALGRASLRFADFTVHPVCAPSRAALMTGRHFLRTGVSHVHGGKDFLHLEEITLAQMLRENGYATGMWGKWHLGTARDTTHGSGVRLPPKSGQVFKVDRCGIIERKRSNE